MTIEEYMSESLFPHSTQQGLTLEQQLTIDATNFSEYSEAKKNHEPMTFDERQIGFELEAKNAARESVLREAQTRQTSGYPQGAKGAPLYRNGSL